MGALAVTKSNFKFSFPAKILLKLLFRGAPTSLLGFI
jgi:hypothetical protein